METFKQDFCKLLAESDGSHFGMSRGFVCHGHTNVYVRIGPRVIHDGYRPCIQIANISTPEEFQSKGGFKRFLLAARSLTSLPFFIENAQEQRFQDGLVRLGFEIIRIDEVGQADLFRET